MKKTVFLALVVCGLVVSFFVGNSMSQEDANRPEVMHLSDVNSMNLMQ